MENNNSFWLKNFEMQKFQKLQENIDVDVCIVGARHYRN